MLTIAISTFFALAFIGAVTVIAMMVFQYRNRIASVILNELRQNELRANQSKAVLQPTAFRHRIIKAPQPMTRNRSLQPVPLRVAA